MIRKNPLDDKTSFKTARTFLTVIVAVLLMSSCASSGNTPAGGSEIGGGSRITACKANDTQIRNSSQCMQDDAACYELSNGQWCTGERGSACPSGSVAVPDGMTCPLGKRCFRISESLECTIS